MDKAKFLKLAPTAGVILGLLAACGLAGYIIGQWRVIDAAIKPAIISGGITLLAAIGGALVVFWQLRKQAENAIKANRHNEVLKLKKDIYQEAQAVLAKATHAQGALDTFVGRLLNDIRQMRRLSQWMPQTHGHDLVKMVEAYHMASVEAAALTDKWRIADPRLAIMKMGIAAAMHDLRNVYDGYAEVVTPFLSNDPKEAHVSARRPSEVEFGKLQDQTHSLSDAIAVVHNYTYDFGIELQTTLLGELFDRTVEGRVSNNANDKVLRLDDYAELRKYFLEETSWGRMMPQRIPSLSTPAPRQNANRD